MQRESRFGHGRHDTKWTCAVCNHLPKSLTLGTVPIKIHNHALWNLIFYIFELENHNTGSKDP